ncbi:MAG: matrixin family metalloprotease [Bdellovibrionia bacterium]
MLKYLLLGSLVLASLFLKACAPKAQEDCGFLQNVYGERISWKSSVPVTIELHESVPDSYIPAIVASLNEWEVNAGRRLFNLVTSPRVRGPQNPQKDGRNIIYFMSSWESNRVSEQGRTNLYWVGDEIKEADIRINNSGTYSFYYGSGSGVNFQALMTHELGHVLGLKHRDSGGSVMGTYLANNVDRVALAETDSVALSCEY